MTRLPLVARRKIQSRRRSILFIWLQMITMVNWFLQMVGLITRRKALKQRYFIYKMERTHYIDRFVNNDKKCIKNVRMNTCAFYKLCSMLEFKGYLRETRNMSIVEQVAIFINILGHHTKMSIINTNFQRSNDSISRHFHMVLNAVLRLYGEYIKPAEPISSRSVDDERWMYFKNCLGALDGTHIGVHVHAEDRPRYRNRKGEITTNVLAACSPTLQLTFVLTGWEGSADDGRVLRDALLRKNGLRVPKGTYYLVDAGYTNGEGFLAPFRGQRYHISNWKEGYQAVSPEEYFNQKHSSARNAIERCFGILKKRWAILRSPSFYPIETQNYIIIACCILHNYIRTEMSEDPMELCKFNENMGIEDETVEDNITNIGVSNEWTTFRNNLAQSMFNERNGSHK